MLVFGNILLKDILIFISIAVIALLVILAVIVIVLVLSKKSKTNANKINATNIVEGVRYTKNSEVVCGDGEMSVTHNLGDIILNQGKVYKAKKQGALLPGKYTLLSADGTAMTFNIRFGDFVREYKHGTDIVIAEGDEICAISHSVILR